MNFGAPAMPMAPPATAPALKRKPFDITKLSPEVQQQLAQGQPVTFEDGSTVYPDGTAEGAGDSPDDFTMGPAQEAPLPPPPPEMLGGMLGGAPAMEEPIEDVLPDPFAGKQFDRHFAVRDSAPTIFGEEEETDGNPMMEAMADPFETPEPARSVRIPSNDDPIGTGRAMSRPGSPATKKPRTMPGKLGQRMGGAKAPATRPQPRRGR